MVELIDNLQISPVFHVSDLYDFHDFDAENEPVMDNDWAAQLPKKKKDVAEKVLDAKKVRSQRWNLYRHFLIKWLSKPFAEFT